MSLAFEGSIRLAVGFWVDEDRGSCYGESWFGTCCVIAAGWAPAARPLLVPGGRRRTLFSKPHMSIECHLVGPGVPRSMAAVRR